MDYAPLVAVGGRLIYATCTVLSAENERVVERFLAERPDFVPMPLKEIFGKPRAEQVGDGINLRLWPHQPRHRRLLRGRAAPGEVAVGAQRRSYL